MSASAFFPVLASTLSTKPFMTASAVLISAGCLYFWVLCFHWYIDYSIDQLLNQMCEVDLNT
jgi:hypothetical protein